MGCLPPVPRPVWLRKEAALLVEVAVVDTQQADARGLLIGYQQQCKFFGTTLFLATIGTRSAAQAPPLRIPCGRHLLSFLKSIGDCRCAPLPLIRVAGPPNHICVLCH